MAGELISAVIDAGGWAMQLTFSGMSPGASYDFGSLGQSPSNDSNPTAYLTVSEGGYKYDGTPTARSRRVCVTHVLRKLYPDNASLEESTSGGNLVVLVALDEQLNSSSTATLTMQEGVVVSGAVQSVYTSGYVVTNNSTIPQPTAIASWDWMTTKAWTLVTTDIPVAVSAYHHRGVAAVRFTATGGTSGHIHTDVVWKRTVKQSPVSMLHSDVFATSISIAGFTVGETITVRYEALPWCGAASDSASVVDQNRGISGVTNITFVKEAASTRAYAVVSTAGSDTTGVSSPSLSTAVASPFLTIGKALASGANTIRCRAGTYDILGSTPVSVTSRDYFIEVSPYQGEVVTINRGGTFRQFKAKRLKFSDVSVTCSSVNGYLDGVTLAGNALWFENCSFNNATTPTVTLGYRVYGTWLVNSQWATADYLFDYSTAISAYAVAGCKFNNSARLMPASIVASHIVGMTTDSSFCNEIGVSNPGQHYDNVLMCNNLFSNMKINANKIIGVGASKDQSRYAIVGNVMEASVSGSSPAFFIGGDSTTTAIRNFVIAHNTVIGQRTNCLYNDIGSAANVRESTTVAHNAFQSHNIKGDTFINPTTGASGGRTGNRSQMNGVDYRGNRYDGSISASFVGDYYGVDVSYHNAPDQVYGQLGYTLDASSAGTGVGYGNYLPAVGSVLRSVSRRYEIIAHDLYGTAT